MGLPYSFQEQTRLDKVTGGSPYGATTIAAGDGSRQPTANELGGAGDHDFCPRVLGLRLMKETVKQDDTSASH